MQLRFDQNQFDAVMIDDTEGLSEIAADRIFPHTELYADMPYEIRKLLAEAAIGDAREHGMDTLPSILGFVETIVEMTPRFSVMEPFKGLLARTDLSPDEKMQRIMSDAAADAWVPVLAHVDAHNDWHLDYWDERVDWRRAAHLDPAVN